MVASALHFCFLFFFLLLVSASSRTGAKTNSSLSLHRVSCGSRHFESSANTNERTIENDETTKLKSDCRTLGGWQCVWVCVGVCVCVCVCVRWTTKGGASRDGRRRLTGGLGAFALPAVRIEAAVLFGAQVGLGRVDLLLGRVQPLPRVAQHDADGPANVADVTRGSINRRKRRRGARVCSSRTCCRDRGTAGSAAGGTFERRAWSRSWDVWPWAAPGPVRPSSAPRWRWGSSVSPCSSDSVWRNRTCRPPMAQSLAFLVPFGAKGNDSVAYRCKRSHRSEVPGSTWPAWAAGPTCAPWPASGWKKSSPLMDASISASFEDDQTTRFDQLAAQIKDSHGCPPAINRDRFTRMIINSLLYLLLFLLYSNVFICINIRSSFF